MRSVTRRNLLKIQFRGAVRQDLLCDSSAVLEAVSVEDVARMGLYGFSPPWLGVDFSHDTVAPTRVLRNSSAQGSTPVANAWCQRVVLRRSSF